MLSTNNLSPGLIAPPDFRQAAPPAATVFLPREHGSWSLALEPVVLALLLAPSLPGFALAAAVLAGFLARRPLRAAFAHGNPERRRAAREALVLLTALGVAGGFEVLVLGDPVASWPVVLAIPGGVLFAYFDAQGTSRAAAAELAGAATFAALPAAFATLAGWPVAPALALVVLALARSLPTVLTIRSFLRRRKGGPVQPAFPVLAALVALGAVLGLATGHRLPWLAAAGSALLLVRTAWFAGPWRPAWSARIAGMTEAGLGGAYLLLTTLACRGWEWVPLQS